MSDFFRRLFGPSDAPAGPPAPPEPRTMLEVAALLRGFYEAAAHPRDMVEDPLFQRGVGLCMAELHRGVDAQGYVQGANPILSLMALEALARITSDEALAMTLIPYTCTGWGWTRRRSLTLIGERAAAPAIAPALLGLAGSEEGVDYEGPALTEMREAFKRMAQREPEASFDGALEALTEPQAEQLKQLLAKLGDGAPERLNEEYRAWQRRRVNTPMLKSIGRIRKPDAEGAVNLEAVDDPAFESALGEMKRVLLGDTPGSLVLTGPAGCGKSALLHVLSNRLAEDGWIVFEAGANDLAAGQSFLGQLEGRVKDLAAELRGKDVVWIIPDFHELAFAGAYRERPTGVLDMLLPYIESGEVRVVGETTTDAWHSLAIRFPRVRTALTALRVESMSDDEALAFAQRWCVQARAQGWPVPDEPTLREISLLGRQYLSSAAQPGAIMRLVQATAQRLLAARATSGRSVGTADGAANATAPDAAPGGGAPAHVAGGLGPAMTMTMEDVLDTLGTQTGLPRSLLDERASLSLMGLRERFESRVLGQPEAVECLVERVAMVKAGVTDPTRPLGVFLFVGPTGTGKTEIAKTLAEFMFGSPDRMIRVDMSELSNPDSLDVLLGDRDPVGSQQALVNRIRQQPFSVVLLDEFEKAHPLVWDLFLQVFDDGRLTDRRGNTADFRHAILILTSNLGAAIPKGQSLGFQNDKGVFTPGSVMKSVDLTFRREFVNRIDRVIVFRPLSRATMRDILRKELRDVFQRRGLRNREWAVEWDESALEFLLDKGFTPDLGARPLKRAVERHVLAPLATTIVKHEVPAGDQFLFVRSDGERVDVQFVDPDAPESADAPGDVAPAMLSVPANGGPSLEAIVLDARGEVSELGALRASLESLRERVHGIAWTERKQAAYARMREEGFWSAADRFEVLGRIENMDRVESSFGNAASLFERLHGNAARARVPADLVGRLAQQLLLLRSACDALDTGKAWDAFVSVRPLADKPEERDEAAAFAARLRLMYTAWCARRRMSLQVLEESSERWLASVSGFAALSLLEAETGWHVLELPDGAEGLHRARAEVRVVAQPPAPAGDGEGALRTQAVGALAAQPLTLPAVVRRYREEPSPLVRDGVRGWRTGRLDRVFAGEFDVMQ